MLRWLAWLQGGYYALTGLWALLDIDSFQAVTGPKTDLWLVKTVGVLVLVIGGVLLLAAFRRHVSLEMLGLAAGSAVGLAAIDVRYVLGGTIAPVYLLDAGAELVLVGLWAIAWRRRPVW